MDHNSKCLTPLQDVSDMSQEELENELIFPKSRKSPKKQIVRSRQQLHAYLKLCKELYGNKK